MSLNESAVAKFKENERECMVSGPNITKDYFTNPSSSQIDHLADSGAATLRMALDSMPFEIHFENSIGD